MKKGALILLLFVSFFTNLRADTETITPTETTTSFETASATNTLTPSVTFINDNTLWADCGVAVTDDLADQINIATAPDGAGGVFITWQDYRDIVSNIYIQRLDGDGNAFWSYGGIPVPISTGIKILPAVAPDGNGGVYVTWYNSGIYMQHLDANGNKLWTTQDKQISTGNNSIYKLIAANDGACLVMWITDSSEIKIRKVDASGNFLYPEIICSTSWFGTFDALDICSDGASGAMLAWSYFGVIRTQKIDGAGNLLWGTSGVIAKLSNFSVSNIDIVSDQAGGVLITWSDSRNDAGDIYTQRVNSSGTIQYGDNGLSICSRTGTQHSVVIAKSQTGDYIISWIDEGTGTGDIYAQIINDSGAILWPMDGKTVGGKTGTLDTMTLKIVPDLSGGAIVSWIDKTTGINTIYAQQFDIGGNKLWGNEAEEICYDTYLTAFRDKLPVISDVAGGAIISWMDHRSGRKDVRAQRISGVLYFTPTPTPEPTIYQTLDINRWQICGNVICDEVGMQKNTLSVSDGTGGGIIVWEDNRSGSGDIFCQKIDKWGNKLWEANGVAIYAGIGEQNNPVISSDGLGGAIIAWSDNRTGEFKVMAQYVDKNGNLIWAGEGVTLCSATGNQINPKIAPYYQGPYYIIGAYIVWEDYRNGIYPDIFKQRINLSGMLSFGASGSTVCSQPTSIQRNPDIFTDESSLIVAWEDNRSGNYDIYANSSVSGGEKYICTAAGDQTEVNIAKDVFITEPVFFTWQDSRTGLPVIYCQQFDGSLNIERFGTNGIPICTASTNQTNHTAVYDGANGIIIAWEDNRFGVDSEIYVQRLNSLGAPRWEPAGVRVTNASGRDKLDGMILADNGGAILSWQNLDSSPYRLYSQSIDIWGNTNWGAGGQYICNYLTGENGASVLFSDKQNGAIVSWVADKGTPTGYDIFSQGLNLLAYLPPTPTSTNTCTPTAISTFTDTITPTGTNTSTVTATVSETVTETDTESPTVTPSVSQTATEVQSATAVLTVTNTAIFTYTATETSTVGETNTETRVDTATITPSLSPTDTPVPSASYITTDTITVTGTETMSETYIPTVTITIIETDTKTPSPTHTDTAVETATSTFTETLTPTIDETITVTSTQSVSLTKTPFPSNTNTVDITPENTATETFSPTVTIEPTASITSESTLTITATTVGSVTITPEILPSLTYTMSPEMSQTFTSTPAVTQTNTPTAINTFTCTPTINPMDQLGQLTVYPNPSSGMFKICFKDSMDAQKVEITVFSAAFRKIRKEIMSTDPSNIYVMNIENVSNGIYYLYVRLVKDNKEIYRIVREIIVLK